jgi:hypothetical protein
MLKLDQDEFITQYVTVFLASWTANEYNMACMRGEQKRLNNPPVDDAIYLARAAWGRLMELGVGPLQHANYADIPVRED